MYVLPHLSQPRHRSEDDDALFGCQHEGTELVMIDISIGDIMEDKLS